MTRPALIIAPAAAALLMVFGYTAWKAAILLEQWEADRLTAELAAAGQGWAAVEADGLTLHATGAAPDEAARGLAEQVVGARRWSSSDFTLKAAAEKPAPPPDYALALMRDGAALTVTGTVPDEASRSKVAALADLGAVDDISAAAGGAAPAGWDEALAYALAAARMMDQAVIHVRPGVVDITATVPSAEMRADLEAKLRAAKPADCDLRLRIAAPPPPLSPYRFEVSRGPEGARVAACAAESEKDRDAILAMLRDSLGVETQCAVALGAPSSNWVQAVEAGVKAVAALPEARFSLSDNTARLEAGEAVSPEAFDTAVRNLSVALSSSYSLISKPPPAAAPEVAALAARSETPGGGPSEGVVAPDRARWFWAVLGPDGVLSLAGAAPDEATRTAILTYARAMAGAEKVRGTMTISETPAPEGWRRAALAGVEALAGLDTGEAAFDGETLRVTGETERPEVVAAITEALAPKIADGLKAETSVRVDQSRLAARLPLSPAQCVAKLSGAVAADPIRFEPSSAQIGKESAGTLDELAAILKRCDKVKVEIGGHTDSQGRESTNQLLSQTRADAVLDALLTRGVSLGKMVAKGYGESRPIADNGTEEGRARNRRIEFTIAEQATPEEDAPEAPAGEPGTAAPAGDGAEKAAPDAAPDAAPATAGETAGDTAADTAQEAAEPPAKDAESPKQSAEEASEGARPPMPMEKPEDRPGGKK